jgi:RimJ/RimL family protein N-acetyltransferase
MACMSNEPLILQGPRIRLRPWREEDREAFAAMNADPEVMRHFTKTLDRAESDSFMDRINAHQAEHGYSFWAIERHGEPGAIGLCGLARIPWEASFTPAVEIGWRLATAHQRQGYAEEAARITLAHGFGPLELSEIVAFTIPGQYPFLGADGAAGHAAGWRLRAPAPAGGPLDAPACPVSPDPA